MKKKATTFLFSILTLLVALVAGYWFISHQNKSNLSQIERKEQHGANGNYVNREREVERPGEEKREAKGRADYFFHLLRNPKTNAIPKNVREHELSHARKMPNVKQLMRQRGASKNAIPASRGFSWILAGPQAVGGRTRALGIDQRNPDIIIAGGVSGGIWKSTDEGETWDLKTPDFSNFSVTSLAQDPTRPDSWYYVAGEYLGNSASATGAPYYGAGIFHSTDNGDTWTRVPGTKDTDAAFDSQFDFISRLIISPTTGTLFFASNATGLFRSADHQQFNQLVLGGTNKQKFVDVAVASNGTLAATISSANFTSGGNPGIFISKDDGISWTEITPTSFPTDYGVSKITFAPSDPNIMYVFTQKLGDASNQGISFYKLDLSSSPKDAKDRGGNLPDFGGSVGGVDLQGGYNMTVSVKPDDPNFVTVGATDLFRSRDGFKTAPSGNTPAERDEYWIGGYAKKNNVSNYPNQHPDQHVQVYDPSDANRLWVGHDGGLSVTKDVTANAVTWQDKNDGYIVTQFYDASLPPKANDNRLMGGTQDNGTPFFRNEKNKPQGNFSKDISGGDGGYSTFTKRFIFVTSQNGITIRCPQDTPSVCYFGGNGFSFVQPAEANNQLFINPFTVDPNNDDIMYYPGGSKLYRNKKISQLSSGDRSGTNTGWKELTSATLGNNYTITALTVSTSPGNILYYAGSAGAGSKIQPVVKRLDNARTSNQKPKDISIPDAAGGAYVHDIAVNPKNSNDILVTMTNYNIVGIYHSNNGGNSWDAVEGNLEGNDDPRSNNIGPSIRSATIVPAKSGPIYLVGTSTGVYSTQKLNGNNTTWGRESAFKNNTKPEIGFSVVENITSRASNGDVAVGTHGRGMFFGKFNGVVTQQPPSISINPGKGQGGNPTIKKHGDKIVITANNFQFAQKDSVFFGEVKADIITDSFPTNKLTVYVPRIPIPQNAKLNDKGNYSVTVVVNRNGQNLTTSFTLLSPQTNELSQNYPNPFTGNTSVPVDVAQKSRVRLSIYSTNGQQVYKSEAKIYTAGTHNIPVDFSGKASGIYVYRVMIKPTGSGDTFTDSKKFTFIK